MLLLKITTSLRSVTFSIPAAAASSSASYYVMLAPTLHLTNSYFSKTLAPIVGSRLKKNNHMYLISGLQGQQPKSFPCSLFLLPSTTSLDVKMVSLGRRMFGGSRAAKWYWEFSSGGDGAGVGAGGSDHEAYEESDLPILGDTISANDPGVYLESDDAEEAYQDESLSSAKVKEKLQGGLYLVATPIGNLEDITIRALRVLKEAEVILAEDTRHSAKLLLYYNIDTPMVYMTLNHRNAFTVIHLRLCLIDHGKAHLVIVVIALYFKNILQPIIAFIPMTCGICRNIFSGFLCATSIFMAGNDGVGTAGRICLSWGQRESQMSYHKFNEYARQEAIMQRLKCDKIIALISDAGMPGISDPGSELVRVCVDTGVQVYPIPGASAVITALVSSGLPTDEFSFAGFLPTHTGTRQQRLVAAAKQTATQIFYVPPHKLCRVLDDCILAFGATRRCVVAREMTKVHEEFRRGTLEQIRKEFEDQSPRGEITLVIEGRAQSANKQILSEAEIEAQLQTLIAAGVSPSEASRQVVEDTGMRRKVVYPLALKLAKAQS